MIKKLDTRSFLAEAMQELAKTKPLDKITVKEIVERCQTTPTTFYRYFHTKYDLAVWIYDSQVAEVTQEFGIHHDWRDTVEHYARILTEDRAFYLNAFRNTSGQDEFHSRSRNNDIGIIKDRLLRINGLDSFSPQDDFLITTYIYGISESIVSNFLSPDPIPENTLAEWCVLGIPEPVRVLFDHSPSREA